MTSAAADRPRGGRIGAFLAWFSHYDATVATVYVVVTVIGGLVYPSDDRPWWVTAVQLAALVLPLAAISGRLVHDRQWMCERCMERFPLDASAEAEQKHWTFRMIHASPRQMLLTAAVAYLMLVGVPFVVGPQLGVLGGLPWFVGWIALIYAGRQHSRLQPWCPWCNNGGRGPRSTVTPPTPKQTVDV